VLPGIIGAMQANETIKLLTGIGNPLINRLLTYDSLNNNMFELELTARKETRLLIPADKNEFTQTDYEWLCGVANEQFEIDQLFLDQLLNAGDIDVIDVREADETPAIDEFFSYRIPLGQLQENISLIKLDTVVTICQSGKRSLQAAKQLAGIFGSSKKIYSLHGGIIQWKQAHSKQLL
jgi:sulfur-carrier protein adenylyltransferase/sulfurtransferase